MSNRCNDPDDSSSSRHNYDKLDAINATGDDICQLKTSQNNCSTLCDSNDNCVGYLYFPYAEFNKLSQGDKDWVNNNKICMNMVDGEGCCYLKSKLNTTKTPADGTDNPQGMVYQKGDLYVDSGMPVWLIIVIVLVSVLVVVAIVVGMYKHYKKNTKADDSNNIEMEKK